MPHAVFVVPGPLDTLTGGYGYDRRIIEGLRAAGWRVDRLQLDASFPFPTAAALADAARTLAGISDDSAIVVDGLAFGAMPDAVEQESRRLKLIALVHHPLAAETGIAADAARRLEISERRALAAARLVVVTSPRTRTALDRYGVEPGRIHVVEPGTDPSPVARGSQSANVQLLCVATLTPRKGHDLLLRALAGVPPANWRLTCVGGLDRDAETTARLRAIVRAERLDDRVSFSGEMAGAALASQYDAADVFVLATLYEGYGMVIAEALARGLPIVSTFTGAIPELVGAQAGAAADADAAGLLVPSNDVAALSSALARVIGDDALRARLAANARRVRARLSTWDDASRQMAQVIASVQR